MVRYSFVLAHISPKRLRASARLQVVSGSLANTEKMAFRSLAAIPSESSSCWPQILAIRG